jgi:prepilin-type processing-associated H-X9-DG protein
VNTSGADGQVTNGALFTGQRTSATPVEVHDFVSPTMGEEANLDAQRARRMKQIFERFGCAATRNFNQTLFGGATDSADFQALLRTEGIKQVSFLAPASFHYFGANTPASSRAYNSGAGNFTLTYMSFATPVAVPTSYKPRTYQVGLQAANKVVIADGTRYLDGDTLDFDITPKPSIYGSFMEAGPIFHSATAYGRGKPESPRNWQLSFRHPGNSMNVGYYDGHVGRMTNKQAWTDATPWYPGGSVYNGTNGTPESQAYHNTPDKQKLP